MSKTYYIKTVNKISNVPIPQDVVTEIKADAIELFKQKIIEYSGEHYIDCDGYYGGNTELVFRVDEYLDDIAEQTMKE